MYPDITLLVSSSSAISTSSSEAVTTDVESKDDKPSSASCAGFFLGISKSADGSHHCCTVCRSSFRKRSSALHTARPYQFGISELGDRRPRAVLSALCHPSWESHVGKTAIGLRGVNFSSKPQSLARRRKQTNDVAYFIGRGESIDQSSLQWMEIYRCLETLAEYLPRAFSVGSIHFGEFNIPPRRDPNRRAKN